MLESKGPRTCGLNMRCPATESARIAFPYFDNSRYSVPMISKLFKPAWEHKRPERRLAAIASFSESDQSHQDILVNIAQSDEDSSVRDKAIELLLDCALLSKLFQEEQRDTANQRLQFIIRSKEQNHQQKVSIFLSSAATAQLSEIACHCPDAEIRSAALSKIVDEDLIASVAAVSEFADTRELAAADVKRLDLLEPLWKKVRERDKNLAKNLRDRIDLLHKVEEHKREVTEQATKTTEAMRELKESVWTPQYNVHFLALVNQWQAIEAEVSEEQSNHYRELAVGVEAIVMDHRKVLEMLDKQKQLAMDAEQLQQDAFALSSAELGLQMERWVMLRRIWLDSLATASPEEAVGQQIDQVRVFFFALERLLANQTAFDDQTIEVTTEEATEEAPGAGLVETVSLEVSAKAATGSLDSGTLQQQTTSMKTAIKATNWPDSFPEPAALKHMKEMLKINANALKELASEEKAQADSIGKQIGRLNGAIRRGDLRMARGVRKKIESKFERSNLNQQKKLVEQWEKAEKAFTEMVDWKEFAIQPKFIELCEQMEALDGSPQEPQKQAEAMKVLQQAWKKLDALAPDEIWQRFQTAGDKAYEPCAAFHAVQDNQRAENLVKRKGVLEKLKEIAFLPEQEEWLERPDWKVLRNQLREIREEWRNYADVDNQKARKVGKRYGELTRKLETHLKGEYDANLARKQQLVERALAMSVLDSAAITLDQLKDLQASWKTIGITERRDDQKLWKQFQEACDAVFAKHRARIDESRAEEKEQSNAAKKVIQAIKALSKAEAGSAPDEAQLNQLQKDYAELPELYDAVQNGLDRDMRTAVDMVHSAVSKFKQNRHTRYLLEMRRRADICAVLEALDPEKNVEKIEKVLQEWELEELPAEANQIMEARKAEALTKKFGKPEFDAAERERRLICIELESLKGKTSPAEDSSLRMEYQMQSLKSKGLGANTNSDPKTLIEGLRKRWYQISSAAKQTQILLDERFHNLVE